ncbi:MAG: thiamine diphosphokinase, partial [Actinomycetota bacterium]
LHVDLVVGDMDSVTPDALVRVEAEGGAIRRHPVDKDATDLELALDEALELRPERILVAGGSGGRFDFVLANALLLAHPRFAAVELDGWFGDATVHLVRDVRRMAGTMGELISLLAVGGPAHGVRTEGLRWELAGRDLPAGVGLGVSNEFTAATAEIRVTDGVLLAVRPGEDTP